MVSSYVTGITAAAHPMAELAADIQLPSYTAHVDHINLLPPPLPLDGCPLFCSFTPSA